MLYTERLDLVGRGFLVPTEVVKVDVSSGLTQLGRFVNDVAPQEQVILRSDGHGIAHEDGRVDNKSPSHWTGDVLCWLVTQIHDGGNRDPKIGDRPPEVGCEDVFQGLLGEDLIDNRL